MRFSSFFENFNTPFALKSDLHIFRKVWHVGTGIAGLLFYYLGGIDQFDMGIGMLLFAGVGMLIETLRLKFPSVNKKAVIILGPLMRAHEKESYTGLPFYALGVSLSLLLYEEKMAVLSIMFLVFSDPISSFIGIKFGKDKIIENKSLQGTMAGFITCYITALIYTLVLSGGVADSFDILAFSLIGGLIGAGSEMFSTKIDDNLTIPLFSGFGLTMINLYFKVF